MNGLLIFIMLFWVSPDTTIVDTEQVGIVHSAQECIDTDLSEVVGHSKHKDADMKLGLQPHVVCGIIPPPPKSSEPAPKPTPQDDRAVCDTPQGKLLLQGCEQYNV